MPIPAQSARRAILLTTGFVGGALTFILPPLLRRPVQAANGYVAPPIVSPDDAQKQVAFPIAYPKWLPDSARLVGVRVAHIQVANEAQYRATEAQNAHPMTGYGLMFVPGDGHVLVSSLPGSPAAAAGVPEHRVLLISVDGVAAANINIIKPLVEKEPITVKFKNDHGAIITISLQRKETYIFRPHFEFPRDKYIILNYEANSGQFAIQEFRLTPEINAFASVIDRSTERHVTLAATDVALSGARDFPTAAWKHGDLEYEINNYQRVLRPSDIEKIVAAM